MTFERSDLLADISEEELAGIAESLVQAGDPDPIATSIAESQAEMQRYIHRYEVAEDWQRKLLRALVLWDLPKRLGSIPAKRQTAYDASMKTLREIRDGKFPDVPLKAVTPSDINLPTGRYGSATRINTSRS